MGKKEQFSEEYQKLRDLLGKTGYICTGSITTVYRKCGKPYCFCSKDEKAFHGPYNVWTRKVKGKTVTRNLTNKQVELCKQCIQNIRELEAIIARMKALSVKYIEEQK